MGIPKTTCHTRSISLPTSPSTLDVSIEEHLCRLKASQAGTKSSSSFCQSLFGIKDLYEQMNSFVHLPRNQQVLSYGIRRGEVEKFLDRSLVVLDISSSVLDTLVQMKESIVDLESAVRRGSSRAGIDTYVRSRKRICKTLSKCLVNLKKAEKHGAMTDSGSNILAMLKEAECISISTLKSMLTYLIGRKPMSKATGWSLVAKLVKTKHFCMDLKSSGEVADLDRVLHALCNKDSSFDTKALLKQLGTLELAIGELQNRMDSVARCFVKMRVTLLNVLNS